MSATAPLLLAAPIRAVRSTLLLSSRAAITAGGHFDDYEARLRPDVRDELRGIIAGTWLPIELANEHYVACDALGLSRTTIAGLGRANGERLSGTLLGTVARLARTAGTTPLMLVEQFPRFWGRIFDGGSLAYEQRGPKDVQVKVTASLLRSTFFRNGLGGTAESMLGLVCSRLFIRVTDYKEGGASATYLVQWA